MFWWMDCFVSTMIIHWFFFCPPFFLLYPVTNLSSFLLFGKNNTSIVHCQWFWLCIKFFCFLVFLFFFKFFLWVKISILNIQDIYTAAAFPLFQIEITMFFNQFIHKSSYQKGNSNNNLFDLYNNRELLFFRQKCTRIIFQNVNVWVVMVV